jgi:hypothetical protein
MSAINPPRNKAARIHNATGGRLRIRPRGGSFCCANSRDSASSSARRRSFRSAAGAASGSRGSSLKSGGTATMLAPKKSGRQGFVHQRAIGESRLASAFLKSRRKTAACAQHGLARQNSHQRECHDCTREDCQHHPTAQTRMGFRHAEQVNRGIRSVKNFRARRALRRRENFRIRHVRRGRFACAFRNFAGHCPDTSTNACTQKQNF